MRGRRLVVAGSIFVVLFVINVAIAYVFYKQYTDKMDSIDRQHWLLKAKIETIEKGTDSYRESIDKITDRMKQIDDAVLDMSRRVDSNDANTRESLSRLQSLRLDIEDWQKRQATVVEQLADLSGRTESLFARIDEFKKPKPANVDLGQIDVRSQQSPGLASESSPSPASDTPIARP